MSLISERSAVYLRVHAGEYLLPQSSGTSHSNTNLSVFAHLRSVHFFLVFPSNSMVFSNDHRNRELFICASGP